MPLRKFIQEQQQGTGLSSKGGQVALNVALGNYPGAAAALMPNSPAKKMFSMGQTIGSIAGGKPKPEEGAAPESGPPGTQFVPGAASSTPMNEDSPLARRQSYLSEKPEFAIDSALEQLHTLDLHPDHKSALAEPLLRAKYYGGNGRPPWARTEDYE